MSQLKFRAGHSALLPGYFQALDNLIPSSKMFQPLEQDTQHYSLDTFKLLTIWISSSKLFEPWGNS
jgi:hypothetical protein